jgi:hypothetical protein
MTVKAIPLLGNLLNMTKKLRVCLNLINDIDINRNKEISMP